MLHAAALSVFVIAGSPGLYQYDTCSVVAAAPTTEPPVPVGAGQQIYRVICRFHVIRRGDGTGGIDEGLIPYMMQDLNYGFRDTHYVFVREPGITYIDNDLYYAEAPIPIQGQITDAYYTDGVLNWFLVPSVGGGPGGAWYGPPVHSHERGIFMTYFAMGTPKNIVTPTHEVGHIFNLAHPYDSITGIIECASGVNCANAGDLVCDTPVSPIVHGLNTTATGIYFEGLPGPCNNDPPYDPDTRNYMDAGWEAGHILRNRFTPGQVTRMTTFSVTHQADLIGPLRPDVLADCDDDGLDDVDEILAGNVTDLNRDLVPDSCQTLPRPGDLLVGGMTPDILNRVRYFDGETGAFRETMWNGMSWVHALRMGSDGLVYMTTTTVVQRLDLATGRTHDNFADGQLDGVNNLVDLLFDGNGDLLLLDSFVRNIRRFDGQTGEHVELFANLGIMGQPKAMQYGPGGDLYVVGNGSGGTGVLRVNAVTGALMGSFITPGAGGLAGGQGLVFHDGFLYVANGPGNNVLRYDGETGDFIDVFVSGGSGGLSNPHTPRFGPNGNLFVASRGDDSVKEYDGADGSYLGDFVASGDDGLDDPVGLLFVPGTPCPADGNDDGVVDTVDFLELLAQWGTDPGGPPDLDGNGSVDTIDFLLLLASWGPCPD